MASELGKVSKWPRLKSSLVRHALNESLNAAARVQSTANSVGHAGSRVVRSRGLELAIGDLVSFAIHVRRLVEVTESVGFAKEQEVGSWIPPGQEESPLPSVMLWNVLNKIVHSRRLHILTNVKDFQVEYLGVKESSEALVERLFNGDHDELRPFAVLYSDRGNAQVIDLISLVNGYDGLLDAVLEKCEENGLHLDNEVYGY